MHVSSLYFVDLFYVIGIHLHNTDELPSWWELEHKWQLLNRRDGQTLHRNGLNILAIVQGINLFIISFFDTTFTLL